MPTPASLAVVLAAGEGVRMRSAKPKVLHEIGGVPMLGHVLATVRRAGIDEVAVVVGHQGEAVADYAAAAAPGTRAFVQAEQRGTADAALAARAALEAAPRAVVVLYGDTPLIAPDHIEAILARLGAGADLVVLGFEAGEPTGYGRVVLEAGRPVAIREERDASGQERAITLCNSGVLGVRGAHALALLEAVGNDNAKGEYYLTDLVGLAAGRGLVTALEIADESEVLGVNDRVQLAAAERAFQVRARAAAMYAGATLIDPDTVTFCADTRLGRDVVVEPHVVFGPGVSIGEGSRVRAFCHVEGAEIGPNVTLGPFARLRPGTVLGETSRVGNFVEVKNARLGEGAKVNHLSYVGDADIGARANVGAGTITCNYDGATKHRTTVGEAAFIGSNSALVAPVAIGARAYVGSGSVITEDVPEDALAIARGRQVVKPGRSPAAAPNAARHDGSPTVQARAAGAAE